MRLAMYAGVCVLQLQLQSSSPSSEHIPLFFTRLAHLPIHRDGPKFHGNTQLLQLF